MQWTIGDKVKHVSIPDWGVGEVITVADHHNVEVRFRTGGLRTTKADRLVRLTEAELAELLPKTRRSTSRPRRAHTPIATFKAAFVAMFPEGFRDQKYLKQERDYKVKASELLQEQLAPKALSALVKKGDYAEVCKRARRLVSATNLVFKNEAMDLKDGLQSPANQELFATALLSQLYGQGPFEARMEGFMNALSNIDAAKWTIATYFSFLAFPEEHLFIKPTPTKRIADACLIELNYRPELNWLTYATSLRLAAELMDQLADLQPRDMIDIQSFMWKVGRGSNNKGPGGVPWPVVV